MRVFTRLRVIEELIHPNRPDREHQRIRPRLCSLIQGQVLTHRLGLWLMDGRVFITTLRMIEIYSSCPLMDR